MASFEKSRGPSRLVLVGLIGALVSGCVSARDGLVKPTPFGGSSAPTHSMSDYAAGGTANSGVAQGRETIVAGPPGSLVGAVAAALGYDAHVREAVLNVERADAGIGIAQSGYFPALRGSADVAKGSKGTLNLTLSQPILDWGKTNAEVDRARSAHSALGYQLAAAREKAALEAARAFIAVKRNDALVAAAQKNLDAHLRISGLAVERASGGLGDSSEVALTGVHRGEAEAALVDATGLLRQSRSVYASRTGQQPGALASVPELPLVFGEGFDVRAAAANTPEVAAALEKGEMAGHALRAQQASLLPTLSAEASMSTGKEGLGIGVYLRSPLYTGLASFKTIEAAQLDVDSEKWRAEVALRDAVRDVEAFQNQASALRDRLGILTAQLETAKTLREDYEDQFRIGQRSLTDLLSVQADVFRIERSLIEAQHNVFDLQYTAAGALGILEQTLAGLPGGAS